MSSRDLRGRATHLAAEANPGAVGLADAGDLAAVGVGDLRAPGDRGIDGDDGQKLGPKLGFPPRLEFWSVCPPQQPVRHHDTSDVERRTLVSLAAIQASRSAGS